MKRRQDWAEGPYHQFLMDRAATPYAWGANDCCLFSADGILSFTGEDLAADIRGKYTDEAGAMATLKAVTGCETLPEAVAWVAEKAGLVAYEYPLMAQRGDLVLVDDAGREIPGLVHLNGRDVVTVGESGLLRLGCNKITHAWKV